MTRKEAERLTRQSEVLQSLGFTSDEAEQLRRISMTLRRWHELECGDGNGHIERDEETGAPRYFNDNARYLGANDLRRGYIVPDREKGAQKRLAKIIASVNVQRAGKVGRLSAYIQTDPRGAALYIIRPGDVPAGSSVDSCYTNGICVY